MECLLVGYGKVGQAIYDIFNDYHNIKIIDTSKKFDEMRYDLNAKAYNIPDEYNFDILLVCFPYSNDFVEAVKEYINKYKIKATIVFSTVQIGTTRQIHNAVHCPIEGRHPAIIEYIKNFQFFMGGYNELAYNFFRQSLKYPILCQNSEHTETLKLVSTSFFGVLLEYISYIQAICNNVGMSYNDFLMYTVNYNLRLLLTPPSFYFTYNNVAGHCIVPNAKLLDQIYPSIFLKEIYRDKEGGNNT